MICRVLFTAGLLAAAQGCSTMTLPDVATESHGRPRAGPKPTQELYNEIAAKDRILFVSVFDTCDTATLTTLVTDDFEMYHDKGGSQPPRVLNS